MNAYDDLGGADAIGAVVSDLYRRVLADDLVADYFAHADLGRLRAHQRAFLTQALGGPSDYSGRPLAEAHASLDITDEAFDRVVEHLLASLRQRGLSGESLDEVSATIEALRSKIVSGGRARALH
jgi:hemoglobin